MKRMHLALFCSGAAGLVYETLWVRMLSVSLGSTVSAVCLVLSVFMAGMALGGWLLGKRSDSVRDPLRLYALLEVVAGLYALATPGLFGLLPGAWAVVFLAPPTLLLGGTLPVLAGAAGRGAPFSGRAVAGLYFWNTLGGACGTMAAGFFLIARLGVSRSLWIAALASWAAALIALRTASLESRAATEPETDARAAARSLPALRQGTKVQLWVLFGLSGLLALAYEALWTRLLSLLLGSSAHAFTLMLAAFLTGIALGSRLAAGWVEKSSCRVGFWGLFQLALGGLSLAALAVYRELPPAYLKLYSWLGESPDLFTGAQFLLAFLVLLGPTLMMGMGFPWFVKIMESRSAGEGTGTAYAVNTLGSAAGPWLASFFLVPLLGLPGALAALALFSLALGCWAMGLEKEGPFRTIMPWAMAGAAALWMYAPLPGPADLHHGVSVYARDMIAKGADGAQSWRRYNGDRKLLFSEDGARASVSVWGQERGRTSLVIDGKVDASDGSVDMPTQLLLGHLPLLASSAGERGGEALVIGLGSGVTVAALARHPLVGITAVEIEPAVVRAARFFEHVNRGALKDPRVALVTDDARRHLRQSRRLYDVIVSEPSNPWIAGMSHLFTAEFYALARKRLAPGGVFCQWFHLYGMTPEALRSGLGTFSAAFPHASVWNLEGDLFLLGSTEPLALDWEALERRLARPGVRADLSPWSLGEVPDLLARRIMGGAGLASLTAGKNLRLHSDDRPFLEFEAPRALRDPAATTRNLKLIEEAGEPVSRIWPSDAQRLRWIVRSLLASGRSRAAQRELAFMDKGDSWYAGLERDLGQRYLIQGEMASAAFIFERRAKRRPGDLAAYLDLARARLENKDRQGALAALEGFVAAEGAAESGLESKVKKAVAAAASSPRPALAYLAAGMGYAWIKEGHNAASAFTRAMELEPGILNGMTSGRKSALR